MGLSDQLSADRAVSSDDPEFNRDLYAAAKDDDRFQWLIKNGHLLGIGSSGQLFLECPWKEGHSCDSGITETAYFPAGTGGYRLGHFKCMHASCAERSDHDYDEALGYRGEDLSDVFESFPAGVDSTVDLRDPMGTARQIVEIQFSSHGMATLVRLSGSWFRFADTHYQEISDEAVRNEVWRVLELCRTHDKKGLPMPARPSAAQVSAIVDALKAVVIPSGDPQQRWLDNRDSPNPLELISLRDGLFDVHSRKLLPHTPAFFGLHALPFDAPNDRGKPVRWLAFLDEVWPGDMEAHDTLQEFFGFVLLADTSLHKALMLIGPPRSGKGVIATVLRSLLGASNVVSPTLNSLSSNFGLEPLIGKLLAIVPDARFRSSQYSHTAVERLLMLTGGDAVTIDRKNRQAWSGKLDVRFVLMSNEVPKLSDTSGAIPSRFITLRMTRSFLGKEDPALGKKLQRELPAIFAWALEGRERLIERGHFVQPKSGQSVADRLAELGNPIKSFVEDRCSTEDRESSETIEALYEAYRRWCRDNGHHPSAKNTFSQDIETAFPHLKRFQPRVGEGGRQVKSFKGIQISDDWPRGGGDDDDDGYI